MQEGSKGRAAATERISLFISAVDSSSTGHSGLRRMKP